MQYSPVRRPIQRRTHRPSYSAAGGKIRVCAESPDSYKSASCCRPWKVELIDVLHSPCRATKYSTVPLGTETSPDTNRLTLHTKASINPLTRSCRESFERHRAMICFGVVLVTKQKQGNIFVCTQHSCSPTEAHTSFPRLLSETGQ